MQIPQPVRPDRKDGLPSRDIWLLPLISVATVLVMLAGAEVASRVFWPEQDENACRVADPVVGHRYRPGCSAVTKTAEGPWVANSYNACGYRSSTPCSPTAPGTRRVALIGSSLSEGYMVPYDDSVGERLARKLSQFCDAPVDLQNLGGIGYSGHLLIPRMAEALRLKPEVVLLLLAPFDIESELEDAAPRHPVGPAGQQPEPVAAEGVMHRVFSTLKSSRAVLVAQHFLFRNPSIYLPLYLRYGDKADFLRPPFSPNWQLRLDTFEILLTALSKQAHDAGVRFIFGFVPQEAQVALMAGRPSPLGVDPEALPASLRAMASRHDVDFIDTSEALRLQPTPERLFYQVDGHLSGRGQPIIAADIAAKMIANPRDAFTGCHAYTSAQTAAPG